MQHLILFFLILQSILFFLMTFHDWVHLPPLTDIRTLEKHSSTTGRILNSALFALMIAIPLSLTWFYEPDFPRWVLISIVNMYGWLSLGTILSWWVPYLFGSSQAHKQAFTEYKNTHHFLPSRADNVVPNTFHVILHLVIWSCFALSLYLFLR